MDTVKTRQTMGRKLSTAERVTKKEDESIEKFEKLRASFNDVIELANDTRRVENRLRIQIKTALNDLLLLCKIKRPDLVQSVFEIDKLLDNVLGGL